MKLIILYSTLLSVSIFAGVNDPLNLLSKSDKFLKPVAFEHAFKVGEAVRMNGTLQSRPTYEIQEVSRVNEERVDLVNTYYEQGMKPIVGKREVTKKEYEKNDGNRLRSVVHNSYEGNEQLYVDSVTDSVFNLNGKKIPAIICRYRLYTPFSPTGLVTFKVTAIKNPWLGQIAEIEYTVVGSHTVKTTQAWYKP